MYQKFKQYMHQQWMFKQNLFQQWMFQQKPQCLSKLANVSAKLFKQKHRRRIGRQMGEQRTFRLGRREQGFHGAAFGHIYSHDTWMFQQITGQTKV
jgi:hypothetical protein